MYPQVFCKGRGVAEGLLAHAATVRPVAGVRAHVRCHRRRLREPAFADGATKWLLPAVGSHVGSQVGGLAEGLVALITSTETREIIISRKYQQNLNNKVYP